MASASQTKADIIIVTTNPLTEKRLVTDLGKTFHITVAHSGSDALKILREHKKSAILMDHSIEDFHTDHFMDKVRNNPVTRNTVFILVSRESSNFFVHQAVRAGVSHYIGIPYEPKVLIEKIEMALDPKNHKPKKIYFQLPTSQPVLATSFGRISYISDQGVHFETRLKLKTADEIEFTSPLAEGIGEGALRVKVLNTSGDCFYNYPLAVDAEWMDPEIQKKVARWIQEHRPLNSPKKAKILCVGLSTPEEEELIRNCDQGRYSLRFADDFKEAVQNLAFLRPAAITLTAAEWNAAPAGLRLSLINEIKKHPLAIIVQGTPEPREPLPTFFECPPGPEGLNLAIQENVQIITSEPNRLYFSKSLEDSRIKIYIHGKVLVLGEQGVRAVFEHDLEPPCNLQLDLKTFTEQDLRNPHVRAWPPALKPNSKESENGKFKCMLECHFLGINDSQGQAIQKWLRDEEVRDKRADHYKKPV